MGRVGCFSGYYTYVYDAHVGAFFFGCLDEQGEEGHGELESADMAMRRELRTTFMVRSGTEQAHLTIIISVIPILRTLTDDEKAKICRTYRPETACRHHPWC